MIKIINEKMLNYEKKYNLIPLGMLCGVISVLLVHFTINHIYHNGLYSLALLNSFSTFLSILMVIYYIILI